jgi:hypothetical protein
MRVLVLLSFLSNSEAGKELNPVKAKARDARGGGGCPRSNIAVDSVPVKDTPTPRGKGRNLGISNHWRVKGG